MKTEETRKRSRPARGSSAAGARTSSDTAAAERKREKSQNGEKNEATEARVATRREDRSEKQEHGVFDLLAKQVMPGDETLAGRGRHFYDLPECLPVMESTSSPSSSLAPGYHLCLFRDRQLSRCAVPSPREPDAPFLADIQHLPVGRCHVGLGVLVPYDAETETGYRSLGFTDAGLRKTILTIKSASKEERDTQPLDELLNLAGIAMDEGDVGAALHLGRNLFLLDAPNEKRCRVLTPAKLLLRSAYSLLEQPHFAQVVEVAAQFRAESRQQ
ncbi:conserved hypothetical protein [Neospora caninum Liverpool]|uniref:Uncharacterized protein n=1 Tax=Neospora caninum (strain Liverpool) TaxID=572307 RepID=F0VHL1_NEOCL|nr:conserved hypothetical protein [Neospora caninum Liverpool]CBZ53205.1 conserved hypothetical protein [Neospora caninum Liverpool]|eukprot:XP_003883237.1 conserved hypothetical protein [Neospora caninum Liverpool]